MAELAWPSGTASVPDPAIEAALEIRDKTILFEHWLHYSDGDRASSLDTAVPLREARDRLNRYLAHLESIPFQPDR